MQQFLDASFLLWSFCLSVVLINKPKAFKNSQVKIPVIANTHTMSALISHLVPLQQHKFYLQHIG